MDRHSVTAAPIAACMSVAAGQAAAALAQLIDQEVTALPPAVREIPMNSIAGVLGGTEAAVTGVCFRMSGGMEGNLLILYAASASETAVRLLTGTLPAAADGSFAQVRRSALTAVSVLVIRPFLDAFSVFAGRQVAVAGPYYAEDYLGACIDFVLSETARQSTDIVFVETGIAAESAGLTATIMLFPAGAPAAAATERG
jgi:chemotaxis protein CheY-P-specific phosphatase CheC